MPASIELDAEQTTPPTSLGVKKARFKRPLRRSVVERAQKNPLRISGLKI